MRERTDWDPLTIAYGHLCIKHMYAEVDGEDVLRKRLFDAVELFRELWPKETRAWVDYHFPDGVESKCVAGPTS